MSGIQIVLMLILIRLIFPVGLLLCLGELARRQEIQYWPGKTAR